MRRTLCALLLLLLSVDLALAQPAANATVEPLTITERQRYFVPRGDLLLVLIDLYPAHEKLDAMSPPERERLLTATAVAQANELGAKPDLQNVTDVRVDFSYIKNLDEYAKQDFRSMVRQGSVMLKRNGSGGTFTVTENKLDFKAP